MFCEGLRLWAGGDSAKLRGRVGPLKKDLTRAGGGEESGRLWEAQSIVFCVSGRGLGGVRRGGWGGSGAVGSELRSELSGCGII